MRKARFIEHQIIAVLKSVEDRRTVKGAVWISKNIVRQGCIFDLSTLAGLSRRNHCGVNEIAVVVAYFMLVRNDSIRNQTCCYPN